MAVYRVCKEVLLIIAEHCDRKTLLSLLQTNKDIHSLISSYEHSISAAKLKGVVIPPQSHILTSRSEQRCVIPKMNSFATVQELELRRRRIHSILNHGGFLLTAKPETIGLTEASMDKFKAGLTRAMHLADNLADAAAHPDITRTREETAARLAALQIHGTDTLSDEALLMLRDAEYEAHAHLTKALRDKQAETLGRLSTLELAFLLTLGEGAVIGWQRYMARYASVDLRFYNKMDAFGELVLREGCFMLWAFVRGTGAMYAHVGTAVIMVAEQIWRYEVGIDQTDKGLSMAIFQELKARLLEAKLADDASFDEAGLEHPIAVKKWAHGLVAENIGCDGWKGYYATEYPHVA